MSEPSDFPAYSPRPPLPVTQPPRHPAPGHRVGRVHSVQTRVEGRGNEASTVTVMTFRIVGLEGGQPAEVEIRGRTLAGTVHDGDWVEVLDQRARSGRYEVARLTNLTTGSEVATYGGKSKALAVIIVLLLVFVLVVIFVILIVGLVGAS